MYRKCPSQRPQQKAEKNRVCLLTVIAVRHADGKGNVVPLFVGWCTRQFCECSLFGKPGIHDHGLRSAKKKTDSSSSWLVTSTMCPSWLEDDLFLGGHKCRWFSHEAKWFCDGHQVRLRDGYLPTSSLSNHGV